MRYAFLSPAKARLVRQIELDYADLRAELRREQAGFTLAADREKLRALDEEFRKDLANALTPNELEEYDLRRTQTAMQLTPAAAAFDWSEVQYRALFAFQQELERKMEAAWDRPTRESVRKEMMEQLRQSTGAELAQQYERSGDVNFLQLLGVAERAGLPLSTAVQVLDVRDATFQRAIRVRDDTALSHEAKRESLRGLAAEARRQLGSILGPIGVNSLDRSSAVWLDALDHGGIATYGSDGRSVAIDSVTLPKPPLPPRAPGG